MQFAYGSVDHATFKSTDPSGGRWRRAASSSEALEHNFLRLQVDDNIVADISAPYVTPVTVSSTAEEAKTEQLFATNFALWKQYDRKLR